MSKNAPPILERRYYAEGDVIVREGELGECAYLIQSGAVEVFAENEDHNVPLAVLEVGQIFGETALISDAPRTASVRASKDCNLIIITRLDLEEKLKKSDGTIRAIVRMLMQRLSKSNNSMVQIKNDISDLKSAATIIYENVSARLPPDRRQEFKQRVLPRLEEFLQEVYLFESGEENTSNEKDNSGI
ncbi:MAG: cyclic nucleotide-binding domain-containing protein [Alphaproteobacteria bacterium]|nr:cyclic nucleotide-binding domain-containing protein [Alphaproteobacteria bacterium]